MANKSAMHKRTYQSIAREEEFINSLDKSKRQEYMDSIMRILHEKYNTIFIESIEQLANGRFFIIFK